MTAKAQSCYTLATQLSTTENPCPGDVFFAQGGNVDFMSASAINNFCLLDGTFKTVDEVPSDYSKCSWSSYIEGMDGLAGKGLIVLDRAGQHHYKWRIHSNTSSDIVFDQVTID